MGSIGVVCLYILGGLVWILMLKLSRRPKAFDIFVSHHKAAAGALARELNLVFSVYCKRKVFIDCDDLQVLHKLATTVEKDVRCMFVLGTKEVLTRPWCIAEVVIAARHHIPMVLCQVNGCTPKFEFDVADMDDAMKSFLTSVNIDPQEVKDSFKALERAPRVQYNTYATDSDRAEQLTAMLRASGTVGSKVKVAEDPMYLRKNPGVEEKKKPMTLVTTSGKRVEALAAARILVHFIRERDTQAWVYDLAFEVGNLPQDNTTGNSRNSKGTEALHSAMSMRGTDGGVNVLVVLTSNFFDDAATLALITLACRTGAAVLGVTVESFGYEFLEENERAKKIRTVMHRVQAHIPNVQADEVIEAVSKMCQVIALPLSPATGSKQLIEAQVDGILQRLKTVDDSGDASRRGSFGGGSSKKHASKNKPERKDSKSLLKSPSSLGSSLAQRRNVKSNSFASGALSALSMPGLQRSTTGSITSSTEADYDPSRVNTKGSFYSARSSTAGTINPHNLFVEL